MLSKNVNSKKCPLKFIFLNEKNQKDSDDFGHKKIDFEKSNFGTF